MAPTTNPTTIGRLDPAGLTPTTGYCHVTVAQGSHMVHVSGQVGIGPDGALAGQDHRSQTEQAMRNLVIALESAGATIDDVAKVTYYVVHYSPAAMQALVEASAVVFGTPPPRTAVTLIGVAALADPAYQIEIEATAVLP